MIAARGIALAATVGALAAAPHEPLPASTLAVAAGGGWRAFWRADRAPAEWRAPVAAVTDAVRWRAGAAGVEWAELVLRGSGEARRTRVVLVRIDPRRVALGLDEAPLDVSPTGWTSGHRWTVELAPATAVVALNAGQFTAGGAWGWVVRDGRELQLPTRAPLAAAVVVDATGALRVLAAASLDSARASGGVREAFQSYPTLLDGGRVPSALRRAGRGVDVAHRDARLALGTLPDGRVLVALTRFDGLGGALDGLPLGLTTPEAAAVMGALGCRDAVLLDGGVSAQLLVREADGTARRWPGLRRVPLGLVARPR